MPPATLPVDGTTTGRGTIDEIQRFAPPTEYMLLTNPGTVTGTCLNGTAFRPDHVWYQWTLPVPPERDRRWIQWTATDTTCIATSAAAAILPGARWYVPTDATWLSWNSMTVTHGVPVYAANPAVPAAPREEELHQTLAAQARQHAAEEAVRVRYREQAARRAHQLLTRYLSAEQRRQLSRHRYFDLVAPSGRIYRIMAGTHGNVREMVRLPDGTLRAVASLCCQPSGVPDADAHLTQMLWLKSDEEAFRRIANIRRYDPNPQLGAGRRRDLEAAAVPA